MSQKSYRKREGDHEVISEDGLIKHVYRANGNRLTIDMSEGDDPDSLGLLSQLAPLEQESEPESNGTAVQEEPAQEIIQADAPDWQYEIAGLLDRLDGSTAGNREDIDHKKKITILALANAAYTGSSKTEIWKRPDCCSQFTYYKNWSKDPLFASVLREVLEIVRGHRTADEIRNVQLAATMIREAAPDAAQVHIDLMKNPNPFVSLQASAKILNMASSETADKGQLVVSFDAAQLADAAEQAAIELEAWNQQQQQESEKPSEIPSKSS